MNNLNTTYCQPANLIPHFWYYKIVDKDGRPDLPCMILLSEIFGWFRNLSGSNTYYSTGASLPELVDGKLAISYDFLSEKLNLQKERIRRKLVKLEGIKVLSREVKNIPLKDGSRITQLYLTINQKFFQSCFRDPKLDIRVREDEATTTDLPAFENVPQLSGEHISKKSKIRSMKPNFIAKDLKDQERHDDDEDNKGGNNQSHNNNSSNSSNPLQQGKTKQKLEDFYPLAQEDCTALQIISGREFTLTAMNEILLDMSKRLTDRSFSSKKGFMNYMAKCFRYEMRDAVKISSEHFKIRSNQNQEEQIIYIQEQYLTKIENSRHVSPEWHLKKKLACVLERSKAYKFLSSYKSIKITEEGNCRILLSKHVELSEHDKAIILRQVQATHETIGQGAKTIQLITNLDIVFLPSKQAQERQTGNIPNRSQSPVPDQNLLTGIWGKIRSMLVSYYGEDGKAIDQNWFSKLEPEINDENRSITLHAPSDFIKDWVQSKYSTLIEKLCQGQNYNLIGVSC